MLLQILTDETCNGILLDIGMTVQHESHRYNWYVRVVTGRTFLTSSQSYHSFEWQDHSHPSQDAA
jgi:NAD+ synthase (glutamine-hydrolysing)